MKPEGSVAHFGQHAPCWGVMGKGSGSLQGWANGQVVFTGWFGEAAQASVPHIPGSSNISKTGLDIPTVTQPSLVALVSLEG